ncbi:MAG: hypothetical protein ACHQFZ_04220 [Acidimicrobiales bacterium]
MTSEVVGLGASDADARWIGVRRHQALLVVAGLALVGDGVVRARAPRAELVIGLVLWVLAAPWSDGRTVGETAVAAARFALRSRWCALVVADDPRGARVEARGRATVRAYGLDHVGRLDLAGRDLDAAEALAGFVDALAASGHDAHLALHVRSAPAGALTVLSLDGDAVPPVGWSRDDTLVRSVADAPGRPAWLLERWNYVRTREGPRAVLRVRDFSAAPGGHAALARAQLVSDQSCLAVHAGVVAASRGRRLAERAVHRHRSDGATNAAAGFRRTARLEQSFARLREREAQVATGRALIHLAVYVTVRAESLLELTGEVRRVRRALLESGLTGEWGRGRQAEWFCRQLPGGPGW